MSRKVTVAVTVLVVAGIAYWAVGFLIPWAIYWGGACLLALLLALTSRTPGPSYFPGGRFLCDSCAYNYGDACRRPERPNATRCPDYRRAG